MVYLCATVASCRAAPIHTHDAPTVEVVGLDASRMAFPFASCMTFPFRVMDAVLSLGNSCVACVHCVVLVQTAQRPLVSEVTLDATNVTHPA